MKRRILTNLICVFAFFAMIIVVNKIYYSEILSNQILLPRIYYFYMPILYVICGAYGAFYGFCTHILPLRKQKGKLAVGHGSLLIWGVPLLIVFFLNYPYWFWFWSDTIPHTIFELPSDIMGVLAAILGNIIVSNISKQSVKTHISASKVIYNIICLIGFFALVLVLCRLYYLDAYDNKLIETMRGFSTVLGYVVFAVFGAFYGFCNHVLPLRNEAGKWAIEYVKLIIWGLPLLIILFFDVSYWYWSFIPSTRIFWLDTNNIIMNVFSAILGNIIVTSFTKEQKKTALVP